MKQNIYIYIIFSDQSTISLSYAKLTRGVNVVLVDLEKKMAEVKVTQGMNSGNVKVVICVQAGELAVR